MKSAKYNQTNFHAPKSAKFESLGNNSFFILHISTNFRDNEEKI